MKFQIALLDPFPSPLERYVMWGRPPKDEERKIQNRVREKFCENESAFRKREN